MNHEKALFAAIDRNDLPGVLAAIQAGVDLDVRRRSNTPLLDAVFARNTTIVSALKNAGAAMENIQGSRDPLTEALNQGDMPTLAALLGTEPTNKAIAGYLFETMSAGPLGSTGTLRNLIRPIWFPLLLELGKCGAIQARQRWWRAACDSYGADEQSIGLLEKYVPLNDEHRALLPILAKDCGAVAVFRGFARAGMLNSKTMFRSDDPNANAPAQGVLGLAMSQAYKPMPVLKWLVKHGASLPGGRERIAQQIDTYIVQALGMHGSTPLTRILAKVAGVDPMQTAAVAKTSDGTTTLHLLMKRNVEHRRSLLIAKVLLENGADPMAVNLAGEPACYHGAFKGKFTPQAIRLFDRHGGDWMEGGVLWKRLLADHSMHAVWISEAINHVHEFTIEKHHGALLESTPAAVAPGRLRRM